MPLLSYWASSPTLSDTLKFPYFGRTYPEDAEPMQAMAQIIQTYRWRNVGILHINDAYANDATNLLKKALQEMSVAVVADGSYTLNEPATYPAAIDQLVQVSKLSIIVGIIYDDDSAAVLSLAYERGLISTQHAWLMADAVTPAAGTTAATRALMHGMLSLSPSPRGLPAWERFSAVRYLDSNPLHSSLQSAATCCPKRLVPRLRCGEPPAPPIVTRAFSTQRP